MRNFFGGDPHYHNVVLNMPFDQGLADASPLNHAVTVASVIKSVVWGKFGTSAFFSGSSTYLSLADHAAWAFGSANFTIEFWYNFYSSIPTTEQFILNQRADGSNYFQLSMTSTGVHCAAWSGTELFDFTASVTHDTTAFHHCALVRSGDRLLLLIDGMLVAAQAFSGAWPDFAAALDIGRWGGAGYYFCGYLDDLRITKGVARYVAPFATPVRANPTHGVAKLSRRVPLALPEARRPPFLAHAPSAARRPLALRPGRALNQDLQLTSFVDFTDGVDLVRGEGTVLSGGAARVIRAQGPNTEHDAADDRTQIAADSRDIIPTDGNITIFAHIYPWGAAAGYTHGFGVKRVGTSGTHTERCGTHLPYTDGKIYFDYGGVVEGTTRISVTMPTSSHRSVYAFTCGPRGMEIWHNGVRIANNSATPTLAAYADAYMLGVHGEASSEINLTSNRFNCYAFGVSRRQLPYGVLQKLTRSPEDMWDVVRLRQATRIPTYMKSESRRPPVLVDLLGRGDIHFNNVALQLSLRSHLRDESKSLTVMTIGGTPTTNLGGMYFNGSSRLYTTSTAALNNPFTTDYTIEAYVRASDWTSWSHLGDGVQHGHMYGNSDLNTIHWWSFGPRNDGKLSVFYYGPGEKVSTRTLLTNTWHHVAMVTDKKANVLRLFIDGQQDSTHAIPSCSNSSYISVAFGQNQYLTGYIRDLRVTPGIARYTSNFTPPMMLPTHGVASASYGIE